MAHRDGDGWVDCKCGSTHWGLNGASGVVLFDPTVSKVLLQLRAEWTHGGRVWGIPGGARDSHETSIESALREMYEEMQIPTDLVDIIHDDRWTDHDDWHYHTVIATTSESITFVLNDETERCAWVHIEEVAELDLHPGLAATWPNIKAILESKSL